MPTGFFYAADLLGFGNIIRNSAESERTERISRWLALVDTAAGDAGVDRLQLISDTVFAAADSTRDGVASLVRFGQAILQRGVPQSLPTRAAICHGDYEWGRLTYGKAVIRAHELESAQNWVGATCDTGLPFVDTMWGLGSLVLFPTPMKSGAIRLHPVIDWEIPAAQELIAYLSQEGLAKESETLGWPYADKVGNTIQFAAYRFIVKKYSLNPQYFHGLNAMQLVQAELEGRIQRT